MDADWYYHDSRERRGPMPLSALLAALAGQPDPRQVSVWREGMANWEPAGTVPELAGRLPSRAPLPPPPPSPRVPAPSYRPASGSEVPLTDAEAIARLYRRLVTTVGLQILLGILRVPIFLAINVTSLAVLTGILALAFLTLIVATAVIIAVTAYRLSAYIAEGPPLLWAIAMFLPCINIIGLLILSAKAQAWCRQWGIRVGFLGPSLESIEEIRRRSVAADFE